MEVSDDWVVGFVDGEGCFYVGINRHPEMTAGYQILPELTVVQHERDVQALYALKRKFKCGTVRKNHGDRYCWRVRSIKHLSDIIVPFFRKHRLKTKKSVEFTRFAKIVVRIKRGDHLKVEGLLNIVKIAQTMNQANSKKLKEIVEILSG